jgi:hypothetical protein
VASLDHIAFAIISSGVAAGAIATDVKETASRFPLKDSRQSLVNDGPYKLIEAIDPKLAATIGEIVLANMTGDKKLFLGLSHLDKQDKHRLIITAITHSQYLVTAIREDQEDDPPACAPGTIFMLAGSKSADGCIVREGREPSFGTRAYMHNQRSGYPTVQIKFGKGGPFDDLPVIETLRQIAAVINRLIDKLEASNK